MAGVAILVEAPVFKTGRGESRGFAWWVRFPSPAAIFGFGCLCFFDAGGIASSVAFLVRFLVSLSLWRDRVVGCEQKFASLLACPPQTQIHFGSSQKSERGLTAPIVRLFWWGIG